MSAAICGSAVISPLTFEYHQTAYRLAHAGYDTDRQNIRRMAWPNPGRSTTSPTKPGCQALISSLEAGDTNPTLESLDKISSTLRMRLGELVVEKTGKQACLG